MFKIFAGEISLYFCLIFFKANDKSNSNSQLNSNLAKISKWAFQWKISFNPNPSKQAIEVYSSNKRYKGNYRLFNFDSTDVQEGDNQKHLSLILTLNWILMGKITKESKITKGKNNWFNEKKSSNSF